MMETYQWYVYEGDAMARNKYPEKTVEKILDVSYQLFSKKGYEKTTIQDIVNALGMSKGAIYHHFKCKEDILDALSSRSYNNRNSMTVLQDQSLSGLERIQKFMKLEFMSSEKQDIDRMCFGLFQIPQFAMKLMKDTLCISAPMFAKMIEEAIKDGSAQVEDPLMCAEVMMMLSNLWASPVIHGVDEELFIRRMKTIGKIMDGLGLPIMDEELYELMRAYFRNLTTA